MTDICMGMTGFETVVLLPLVRLVSYIVPSVT